jgi:hypothetical protein
MPQPVNANFRRDIKNVIACNQCGSSALYTKRLTRRAAEEWSKGSIVLHRVDVMICSTCDSLVLTEEPKNPIEKSLMQEFASTTNLAQFLYKHKEFDMNSVRPGRKFMRRRPIGSQSTSALPEIDPDKPLVEEKKNG